MNFQNLGLNGMKTREKKSRNTAIKQHLIIFGCQEPGAVLLLHSRYSVNMPGLHLTNFALSRAEILGKTEGLMSGWKVLCL